MIPTYKVISRHASDCVDKKKGQHHLICSCRKSISVYDPDNVLQKASKKGRALTQFYIKTKSRDWREAEQIAETYRAQHNPDKQEAMKAKAELAAMKAEKESQTASLAKAVAMFYANMKADGVTENRIKRYYSLLGHIDLKTLSFVSARQRGYCGKGRLFTFLETLKPQPVNVSDLTPVLIQEFRNTWDYPSDLTANFAFKDLSRFFDYCIAMRWIEHHPMVGMKPTKVTPGNRTTAFSEQQYDSIVAEVKSRFPETLKNGKLKNLEDKQRYEDTHRLLAFIELMRWSGMALIDAVCFKLDSMKDNGDITYYRIKTRNRSRRKGKATPTVLPHVVDLLRATVPIDGDLNMPFYDKAVELQTNKNKWSTIVKDVFAKAGIDVVKTDVRDREPHCHMLRDTFAVGQLLEQYAQGQINEPVIADALGDRVETFRNHYQPLIDELEQAKRNAQRTVVDGQAAKWAEKQKQGSKVRNIGRRK